MYYPCSENKGADQLRSYCEADLRLCFRLFKLLVFLCGGSSNIQEEEMVILISERRMATYDCSFSTVSFSLYFLY